MSKDDQAKVLKSFQQGAKSDEARSMAADIMTSLGLDFS